MAIFECRPTIGVVGGRLLRRFAGDRGIVGRQINLNNVAFTIAGVTPPGFEGTGQVGSSQDISIPIAWEPQVDVERSMMKGAGVWWLRLVGRLKPGATLAQAQATLENAFQQSALEHRAAGGHGQAVDRATQIVDWSAAGVSAV